MEKEISLFEILKEERIGGRESGVEIRKIIEEEIKKGNIVILNFDKIELTTQGFIDEILGVIIRSIGFEKFKNHVKIKNVNSFIKTVISMVISYSKEIN